MTKYTFTATLLASFEVQAETRREAEAKLRSMFENHTANFGMLDDEPVVSSVEVEGALDLDAEDDDLVAPCQHRNDGRDTCVDCGVAL